MLQPLHSVYEKARRDLAPPTEAQRVAADLDYNAEKSNPAVRQAVADRATRTEAQIRMCMKDRS